VTEDIPLPQTKEELHPFHRTYSYGPRWVSSDWRLRCNRRTGSNSSLLLSQLAPTFLLLGIYNKLVKVAGSDRYEQQGAAFNP
jgi:hypothetical protein